jgi:plasmid stabilization system protein ParE
MAKAIILTPQAEDDLYQSYGWYENKRTGLGRDFITAVDACLHVISRNPQMYQVIYRSYRRSVVRRFPFSIIYGETDSAVIIYAVFDSRQDAEKWRERLQQ